MKRLLLTSVLTLAALALADTSAQAGCKFNFGINFGFNIEINRNNNCCPPPCCVDGCGCPVMVYDGAMLPPAHVMPQHQGQGQGQTPDRRMPGSGEPGQMPYGSQRDAQQIGYFQSNGYDADSERGYEQGYPGYDAGQSGGNYQGYNWQNYGYQVPSYWYGR